MNPELGFALAFVTGLGGALHCLGMCGGIAAGNGVYNGVGPRLSSPLVYHLARVAGYVAIGAAGAALGRVLVQSGWFGKGQGVLMMIAGLVVIAIALRHLTGHVHRAQRAAMLESRPEPVQFHPRVPRVPRQSATIAAIGGLLNGFIPCGLVFSVALPAAATGDPMRGGLLMASFGLGTLPTMFVVSLAAGVLGERFNQGLVRGIIGVAILALGLWTLYQGWVFFDIMRGLAN
ncbi:MAG: sulfite exporter TauE/SafE family protein [Thiotrichales bacterium]